MKYILSILLIVSLLLSSGISIGMYTNNPYTTNTTQEIPYRLIKRTIENEGTIAYQKATGSYKDGLFFPYKDSEGFLTIGYGHRVYEYHSPITEEYALSLLIKDLTIATKAAEDIIKAYNLNVEPEVKDILIDMCFQMGKDGVLKFKRMLKAMQSNDYDEVIKEMKDSKWYKQTPNRVHQHIKVLRDI